MVRGYVQQNVKQLTQQGGAVFGCTLFIFCADINVLTDIFVFENVANPSFQDI